MVNNIVELSFCVFHSRSAFDHYQVRFGAPFWYRFEGPGRHYTPSGVSLAPFWDPLEALWGFVTLSRPSVSSLWVSLWSFGSDFFCALKPSKVWVLDHLGAARAPLYSFWVAFCAREASSWVLWGALDARLGVPQRFPGTLSMQFGYLLEIVLFRSCFCAPWWGVMCNPYTPAHVS